MLDQIGELCGIEDEYFLNKEDDEMLPEFYEPSAKEKAAPWKAPSKGSVDGIPVSLSAIYVLVRNRLVPSEVIGHIVVTIKNPEQEVNKRALNGLH